MARRGGRVRGEGLRKRLAAELSERSPFGGMRERLAAMRRETQLRTHVQRVRNNLSRRTPGGILRTQARYGRGLGGAAQAARRPRDYVQRALKGWRTRRAKYGATGIGTAAAGVGTVALRTAQNARRYRIQGRAGPRARGAGIVRRTPTTRRAFRGR